MSGIDCDAAAESASYEYAMQCKDEEITKLRAEVDRLDDGETRAIKERDHAEEVIDKLCDAVLGHERHEWSSSYYFADAVDDVENEIARLRAELDNAAAAALANMSLACQKEREADALRALLPEVCLCVEYAIDYGSPSRKAERKGLLSKINVAMGAKA